MLNPNTTRKILAKATEQAQSAVGGGLERKANDLSSYAVSGVKSGVNSGVAFGIQHIPFAGPSLAKVYSAGAGLAESAIQVKAYEQLLQGASTRGERIQYGSALLAASTITGIRQAYNTLVAYVKKDNSGVPTDCQESFRQAYGMALAAECVSDLRKWCRIVRSFVDDVEAELARCEGVVDARKQALPLKLEMMDHHHPQKSCMGLQTCYWKPDPSPFGISDNYIGNDQL